MFTSPDSLAHFVTAPKRNTLSLNRTVTASNTMRIKCSLLDFFRRAEMVSLSVPTYVMIPISYLNFFGRELMVFPPDPV